MNRRAFLRLSASAVVVTPGLVGCAKESGAIADEEPRPEPVEATLTKGPWLTILAPGMVRLSLGLTGSLEQRWQQLAETLDQLGI